MKNLLIIVVLFLNGCGATDSNNISPNYTKYAVGSSYVYEFKLKDGTQCVTAYNMGLACNWKP